MPVRRVEKQAVLRRHTCGDQIQGRMSRQIGDGATEPPAMAARSSDYGVAEISRMRVISEGTPKRFGGPQYPVPRLTYTHKFFNRYRPPVKGWKKRTNKFHGQN